MRLIFRPKGQDKDGLLNRVVGVRHHLYKEVANITSDIVQLLVDCLGAVN